MPASGSSCGAPHQLGKFASKCRIGESNTWASQQPDDLDALRIEAPLNVGASAAWSGDDGADPIGIRKRRRSGLRRIELAATVIETTGVEFVSSDLSAHAPSAGGGHAARP